MYEDAQIRRHGFDPDKLNDFQRFIVLNDINQTLDIEHVFLLRRVNAELDNDDILAELTIFHQGDKKLAEKDAARIYLRQKESNAQRSQ